MIGRCRKTLIGAALIAAPFMLAPAAAQRQQPTAQSDFSCYALLTSQAQIIAINQRIAPAQKAERLRQLDILIAFFQGRISQLPAQGALAMLNRGKQVVVVMPPAEREAQLANCTAVYSSVDGFTQQLDQGLDPAAP